MELDWYKKLNPSGIVPALMVDGVLYASNGIGGVEAFDAHEGVSTGEDLGAGAYAEVVNEIPALATAATAVLGDESSDHGSVASREATDPALLASAVELVLEGLHLSRRLNKETSGPRSRSLSRGGQAGGGYPGTSSGCDSRSPGMFCVVQGWVSLLLRLQRSVSSGRIRSRSRIQVGER